MNVQANINIVKNCHWEKTMPLMCCCFAEELDEVQRHQGLLKELQTLAFDGKNKF